MNADDLIRALGGPTQASERLGLKRTTVTMWRHCKDGLVPVRHVPGIEEKTGIPRHILRPDFWAPSNRPRAAA